MEEQFHESTQLSKDVLRPLLERNDRDAFIRFAIQFSLFMASAWILVFSYHRSWWVLGPALFVFALMNISMFAAQHETGHNTAFRSRTLNRIVSGISAFAMFYTPTFFQQLHFAHHRHTHDLQRDPEIAIFGKHFLTSANLVMYLNFISGLPLLLFKVGTVCLASLGGPKWLWDRLWFYIPERHRAAMIWECRLFFVLYAGLVTVGILWLPTMIYLVWGYLLGHFMLSWVLAAEHTGLPHEGDMLERTRTTLTSSWFRFVMWNMPYHTEHHAYPAVPWHALPALHEKIQSELKHTAASYPKFHQQAIGPLLRGRPFKEPPVSGPTARLP